MARVRLKLCTGDVAILVGVAAIACYEKIVRNDSDLISNRVSAYRKHRAGRVVADVVILATALHLSETLPCDLDPYHWLMRWVRKTSEALDSPPE
ncbi:hypothetical protein FK535_09215 [Mycolicibacterium sp. 018/SC-01/001]|uniref:DUF7427 family protein n=1 Tax=Mycolicibacterium sp. 018/SC-01/001 TaxID=2592069 RepID=UPI00117F86A6|nr:hypothetical protein [Mycolicibacterium sp. 018/SC-01/001]TRW85565.1 hypothetical protein FK535_09215 [Mycolicibacterium sp. 018/SC-01/001]